MKRAKPSMAPMVNMPEHHSVTIRPISNGHVVSKTHRTKDGHFVEMETFHPKKPRVKVEISEKVEMKPKAKAKSRMTEKAYEHTKMDEKADRKEARKHKEPVSKWEKSKEDKIMDRAAVKKINADRRKK